MPDGTDVTSLNYATEAERANCDFYCWDRTNPEAQFKVQAADLGAGGSGGSGGGDALEWVPNFTDDGEVRIFASAAMTITQQGTSGTGSVAYQKSTAASPSTFSSAASPITLEAGAWLKVTASSVDAIYAVALKRTA